ncbi:hypothetical protein GA0070606_4131 [Micromonospora citrea]|uniref:Uncharacterized protein n=1 Tax=Micromonospora citrea TaxID=47855 RepID=A0A1C6VGG4_9ACTN|nr:DUF6640 family protein [Micromonospora citrea]SCL65381.1 hypothetical protein GA0070606_4131 [Micromonospora citrea]
MTLPRTLTILVATVTTIGALLADLVVPDLAAQHVHNPGWPPHAKFHDAQYVVMTVLLGLIGLGLAARPGPTLRARLLCADAVVATPWLGMLGALLFPGTAAYDPEFADRTVFVLGMHGQIFMAVVLLLALVGSVAGALRTPARRPVEPMPHAAHCACSVPGTRGRTTLSD